MPAPPARKHHPRDVAILRHLADGPSWYAAISKLFFEGKSCGHIVKRLAETGLVGIRKRALPGGVTLVEIEKAGCRFLGDIPIERAKPAGTARLDLEIAVRWYCVMEEERRYRLHGQDLERLFGKKLAPPANAVHVASLPQDVTDGEHPRIARAYFAGSGKQASLKQLRTIVDEAYRNAAVRPWAEAGDYLVLALCDRDSKAHSLRQGLGRAKLQDNVKVAVAPSAVTLSKFLKARSSN